MIDRIQIACLARDYETKRQVFQARQYQNIADKTPEQLREISVAYYTAEAEMLDAWDALHEATGRRNRG